MTEDTKNRLGGGNVTIDLLRKDGAAEQVILKPSLHAVRTLSNQSGGIVGAIERVGRLDFDLIVLVIRLGMGAGRPGNPGPEDLADRVYKTGIGDDGGLAERCVNYLQALMSGGRAPKTEARDDSQDPTPTG